MGSLVQVTQPYIVGVGRVCSVATSYASLLGAFKWRRLDAPEAFLSQAFTIFLGSVSIISSVFGGGGVCTEPGAALSLEFTAEGGEGAVATGRERGVTGKVAGFG